MLTQSELFKKLKNLDFLRHEFNLGSEKSTKDNYPHRNSYYKSVCTKCGSPTYLTKRADMCSRFCYLCGLCDYYIRYLDYSNEYRWKEMDQKQVFEKVKKTLKNMYGIKFVVIERGEEFTKTKLLGKELVLRNDLVDEILK